MLLMYEMKMKTLEMRNIKDYHDLYLKCDVSLLTDVFEKFRSEFTNSFELHPGHYLSAPVYSLDAMLRFAGVSLKLISDI